MLLLTSRQSGCGTTMYIVVHLNRCGISQFDIQLAAHDTACHWSPTAKKLTSSDNINFSINLLFSLRDLLSRCPEGWGGVLMNRCWVVLVIYWCPLWPLVSGTRDNSVSILAQDCQTFYCDIMAASTTSMFT